MRVNITVLGRRHQYLTNKSFFLLNFSYKVLKIMYNDKNLLCTLLFFNFSPVLPEALQKHDLILLDIFKISSDFKLNDFVDDDLQ